MLFHVPAGKRFAHYVQSFQPLLTHKKGKGDSGFGREPHATILKDFTPQESLALFYRLLHLDEDTLEELPGSGFSAECVRRETARAVEGVKGEVKVYPGIGMAIAGGPGSKTIEPEDVKAAIRAAYEGGASGIILCRNYAEAWLKNLEAAGETLRALGKV